MANPCRGEKANITFEGQSTSIFPVADKVDTFIFMADKWNPDNLADSRYIWLPVCFESNGTPYVEWKNKWRL